MAEPPKWIEEFADQVAQLLTPVDLLGPVGCHYAYADDCWEITLFVSSTEVVGGELDGKMNSSRFTVDLLQVCALFTQLSEVFWQNEKIHMLDELGCHLELNGLVETEPVSLRICSKIPGRFRHGRIAYPQQRTLFENW